MVHMDNCPEFLLTYFACAELGAVAVCTNTKSSVAELSYFGDHASVVAAVTQAELLADLEQAIPQARWIASTPGQLTNPAMSFDELMRFDPDPHSEKLDRMTPLSIQYTSGTTARPKAVMWTHANALFGAKTSAQHESLTGGDIHLVHLPLFHTNAQMYSILASLWVGATAVLQPRFSASRFWDVALRHRCTWSSVVPFCVKALAEQGEAPRHQFRLWGSGVACPAEDGLFGVRTIGWFGMTETVSHCTVDDPEHPGRPYGMGRPASEYGVRLVGEDGLPVGLEEVGNLEVFGTPGVSLFAGYLDDPAATAGSYTEDGWFMTGDLARLHPDGHLSFAGRSKDMLKVGGENVAAAEVEAVIASVVGVSEAAVVARGDDMLHEVPVAFVIASQPSIGLAELIKARCMDQLASFKVPREIRFVEEFPRSTLNKVAKAKLRSLLSDTP